MKYRIVRYIDGFEIQKKFLFFWCNIAEYNYRFDTKEEAEEFLEEYINPVREIVLER